MSVCDVTGAADNTRVALHFANKSTATTVLTSLCLCANTTGAADNTRVALHFANAAKRVTMQPLVNEVVNQKALLRKLRDEVALLRKQLVRHVFGPPNNIPACPGSAYASSPLLAAFWPQIYRQTCTHSSVRIR